MQTLSFALVFRDFSRYPSDGMIDMMARGEARSEPSRAVNQEGDHDARAVP